MVFQHDDKWRNMALTMPKVTGALRTMLAGRAGTVALVPCAARHFLCRNGRGGHPVAIPTIADYAPPIVEKVLAA